MRKLIGVALLIFCSCSYTPHEGEIIKAVNHFKKDNECQYTTEDIHYFYAPCDKYNIGDTLKFCK